MIPLLKRCYAQRHRPQGECLCEGNNVGIKHFSDIKKD